MAAASFFKACSLSRAGSLEKDIANSRNSFKKQKPT
jgi:hypothetical protein